jgi:predicted DNA-binding transcriptional regulator YafY
LVFAEQLLYWRGWLRRSDIVKHFGVSTPQASADIGAYQKLNGGAVIYNSRSKRYEGGRAMKCKLCDPTLEAGLNLLSEVAARVPQAHIDLPVRKIPAVVARDLVRATSAEQALEIHYLSVNSNAATWRIIVPRAFAHDGYRWHVRAWCPQDGLHKDFVLGRIRALKVADVSPESLPTDSDWNSWTTLRLRPHRDLGEVQSEAIKHDYGMAKGVCLLRVRRAMLSYTLAYLRVSAEQFVPHLELESLES